MTEADNRAVGLMEITSEELTRVSKYVGDNTVSAMPGRKCVDGRYGTIDSGMIATPGGDLGDVMVLMALSHQLQLGLSMEQCFNAVYDAAVAEQRKFNFHTDQHSEHDNQDTDSADKKIGCGHAAKPTNQALAALYGLDAIEMQSLVNYALIRAQHDQNINQASLPGDHEEAGVLINNGISGSVNPNNGSDHDLQMYFVYDAKRYLQYVEKLIPRLNTTKVTVENWMVMHNRQLDATLRNLAAGKPKFVFNADNIMPEVTFAGRVS